MNKPLLVLLTSLIFISSSIKANNNRQIDSLLKICETSSDTVLVNNWLQIASYYGSSQPDSAFKYLLLCEQAAKEISFEQGLSRTLYLHANIFYFNNNYSEAEDYFNKCLELSEKMNNQLLKARCLERMASLNLTTDNPHLALKLYFESLVIFEELNDLKGIAKIYNILGVYKADAEEFDLAETYLKKSLEIHLQLNDQYNVIENKGNLGYLYEQTGDLEKAEKIYRDLIPEIQELNDMYALPIIYFNMASIYQTKGKNIEALEFLNKAIYISEQSNDAALLSSLYGNAAELLIELGDIDSARILLNKSTLCARSINDVETEMQALMFVAYIDSLAGDFISAFSTNKLISSLKDTLYEQRLKHSIEESELRYENQKNQNKIALQEKTIHAGKKNKWLFIILFIISGVAVLLLVWLNILRKKSHIKNTELQAQQIRLKQLELERVQNEEKLQKLEKEKIEEVLSLKERELVSLALQMEQSKVNLGFIRQKIKDLIDNNDANIPKLKKLDEEVRIKIRDFDNWDLFYKSFNEIHKDFFSKLKDKHPNLTNLELKHCAYICIHLSSNQLSSLLNITIEAIRKTRYRIRKKLELDPNNSLENYLLRF